MSNLLELSRPSDTTWQITLTSPPDNRLTDKLLGQLNELLDKVELEWRSGNKWESLFDKNRKGGSLIITSSSPKFFSNGLDFENSLKNPNFHPGSSPSYESEKEGNGHLLNGLVWRKIEVFSPVMKRLLTFPLVTIALINGHAFAGGFMLALCCDYRLMTDGKAWCCMNEIDFGAPFPPFFGSVLKHKLPTPTVLREVSLGKRFTAPELRAVGVVDQIIPSSELREKGLKFAEEIGKKSAQGPWGAIKEELYYDAIQSAQRKDGPSMPHIAAKAFFDRVKGNEKLSAKL